MCIKTYTLEYLSTDAWNWYRITVNGKYTGVAINIPTLYSQVSIREKIAEAINEYNKGVGYSCPAVTNTYTDPQLVGMVDNVFDNIVLSVKKFANRDELSKLNLIP